MTFEIYPCDVSKSLNDNVTQRLRGRHQEMKCIDNLNVIQLRQMKYVLLFMKFQHFMQITFSRK